ncbi:MAG: VWA domain-containing protein [Verrucomicrobiota bacterium]|nr:VWA domain-containing protein [Verrucomicrobiota bacterium]
MPYTAEISRVNPSCFIFLIDQSGSMVEPIAGGENKRKCDGVADAINRLLHNLIIKCARGEGVRNFYEVCVIGYGETVGPGFSGKLAGRELVPISEVASSPARVEERTKEVDDGAGGVVTRKIKFPIWFEPKAKGTTPMGQALSMAHKILADWTAKHQSSYPPIVINITDGEATDTGPVPQAESLCSLSTFDGNVLLLNCHISNRPVSPIIFPEGDAELPDEFARILFSVSSVLPTTLREMARNENVMLGENARGFAFNADLVELIRFLDIGTRSSNLR